MAKCSQLDCAFATSGVCLEGHKQPCPHLLSDEVVVTGVSSAEVGTDAVKAQVKVRRFHSGEKLSASEASLILGASPTKMVFLAGAPESGKTTFVARIGELFGGGLFLGHRFSGSFTLCAFDRASWYARIASGMGSPTTMRTPRKENDTFYHLRVTHGGKGGQELLLSDLTGEAFIEAVASQDVCKDSKALLRADHIVVFINCAKIVDLAKRHAEFDNARSFLQRVVAVRADAKQIHLQVVFSQKDYILRLPDSAFADAFCETIRADLVARFRDAFASLTFFDIAARPQGISADDSQLISLFSIWCKDESCDIPTSKVRSNNPARDFLAFGL